MHLDELKENTRTYLDAIEDDEVFLYLERINKFISDIEIASALELPIPLVRQELSRLINQNKIKIRSVPSKVTDCGGLEYKCHSQ